MSRELPILYSFRRCPYAMRARVALQYSGTFCYLREVDLKNKPQALIDISPKATVPVLQLPDGKIIDESLDIIYYALKQNDPDNILVNTKEKQQVIDSLVSDNDREFVKLLRQYKYFERYPEKSQNTYRQQIEQGFLQRYERLLAEHQYMAGEQKSVADIAIMPFIRQFALTDSDWFFSSKYNNLIKWLNGFLDSDEFKIIMNKYKVWTEGDEVVIF